ncbi:hypothetical protein R1flu_008290 [Riccia fluitans]|uniref:Endonuclease/exonuclease/phosphatase domain-containing protein n=1 Tax=Riccia fluitans TaxID=41844 RepID=A0ABD1YBH3_9MARC
MDPEGHYAWAAVRYNGHLLHVLSLYVTCIATDKLALLTHLIHHLPVRDWVCLADWNCKEHPGDASGTSPMLSGTLLTTFQALKVKLGLVTAQSQAHVHVGPQYTRYKVVQGELQWSTLDCIYFGNHARWLHHVESLTHVTEHVLSDRLPVVAEVHLGGRVPRTAGYRTYFKFDAESTKDPQTMQRLEEIWTVATSTPSDPAMAYLRGWRALRSYMRSNKWKSPRNFMACQSFIWRFGNFINTKNTQPIPCNNFRTCCRRNALLRRSVIGKFASDPEPDILDLRVTKISLDTLSAYFFRLHKKRLVSARLTSLKLDSGDHITDPKAILQHVGVHFKNHFTVESHRDPAALKSTLATVSSVVSFPQ